MSNTTDAWQELYNAQTEATGIALMATVAGIPVQVIASALTTDQIFAAGGTAENGGYNLTCLASKFPVEADLKFADVRVFETDLQVINSNNNNGVFYLTCGDFVVQEGN